MNAMHTIYQITGKQKDYYILPCMTANNSKGFKHFFTSLIVFLQACLCHEIQWMPFLLTEPRYKYIKLSVFRQSSLSLSVFLSLIGECAH
jgi:hypothetical protein